MFLTAEKYLTLEAPRVKFKQKGGILYEILIYGFCLLLIAYFYNDIGTFFTNITKRAGAGDEAKQIAQQVVAYSIIRKDGKLPPNLEILLEDTAIPASDSYDGIAYGKFLQKTGRWADGKVVDPWGVEYEYTKNADDTGKITSVGGEKEITIYF